MAAKSATADAASGGGTAGERPSHSRRRCRQRDRHWTWGNTTTAAAVVASFHSKEGIRCSFP